MKAFIPRKFDIESHVRAYSPLEFALADFDVNELKYLLSQIILAPALNRKLKDSMIDDFVPLYSKILQSYVHDYAKYFTYLEKTGIIEINKSYRKRTLLKEGQCKGYKFSKKYINDNIIDTTYDFVYSKRLKNHTDKGKRVKYNDLKKEYGHILKWFYPNMNCKLMVNYEKALEFIELEKLALIAKPELQAFKSSGKDKIFKTFKRKDPNFQYQIAKTNIEKVQAKDFDFIIDNTVNRFHHVLTNMKGILRNFITYDGETLYSIDLKNSQPYISTLLFNKKFWSAHSNNTQITYKTINNNKRETQKPYMLEYICQVSDNQSFRKYISLVGFDENNDEDIYTFMKNNCDEGEFKSRDDAKKGVFEVLFTSNKYNTSAKKVFKKLFPEIAHLFEKVKAENKADLPILLQRLESHIFLNIITKRIARKYPKMPIFTIHDSIITTEKYAQKVYEIIEFELTKITGIRPMLKKECWSIVNPDLLKLTDKYNKVLN